MIDMEEMLNEFLNSVKKDAVEDVLIGKVSKELASEWDRFDADYETESNIIKKKMDLYFAQLKKEHDLEGLRLKKIALWEKIYIELGIAEKEQNESHNYSPNTGEVFREVAKNDESSVTITRILQ